ncbi:MAG: NB-ARC domain-containing protein [Limnospira sp. PMC 1291.21]|uniref:NB-ARC domain-containing protein n=1 Tax=unclassified Limnospira TaxID=2642885 RepID=UPI0028E0B774|nr:MULTISPECIES: NB-ARC domain-containing protein [unclassified Limnospira]MDT9177687.1 NB-ARC domain-containing protein [Limnospira sp. PMC 1238.20]MDT9194558.1 NB-ARC domain-containing protein [Limnospira sp. PMC 1245.20]MDT9195691.1 NB-ARC domain-containing protein [Limnospira sp. PMC 1245.20]MDT9203311.1 NB-ARC domain-containing protein [Limnospira sp. PMC 1243.20]MDT9208515.1 NB-ARC domain-containing protein [Limnospira sp. PMC 1252.20]
MDVQEVLQWTDRLVFDKTGKHLSSLQQAVLTGVWDHQKYNEIADEYHCTEANVKRVAGNLWKLISEELDEKVDKKNFRATMERYYISNFSSLFNFGQSNFVSEGSINICSDPYNHPPNTQNRSQPAATTEYQRHHDLSEAPEIHPLYSRTHELDTLKQWILAEHHRIIAITGLSGIGKTSLARQLVEDIKENFDRIIWRSHRKYPNLNALKSDLLQFIDTTTPSHNSILDYLRSHRCLIILDDFQETLTPGEFVGTYRPEYDRYGQFIYEIGRSPHQSCFLVLSWEQPTEIATMETENRHGKTLYLQGFSASATEILATHNLQDTEHWIELIQLYGGNPLWLNIIAATIFDLFNGSVSQFLSYPSFFLGDIEPILNQHYLRFSSPEKLVILGLANQNGITEIAYKLAENLSESDYLKAVQSLKRRSLIETKIENYVSVLTLTPPIKEYFKTVGVSTASFTLN